MDETKILVLSDIHYPKAELNEISEIIVAEIPDKLILLGDVALYLSSSDKFFEMINKIGCKNYSAISGDDDVIANPVKRLEMDLNGRKLIFMHGHQFNVLSERITERVATLLKKINPNLPVFAFALVSRVRSCSRAPYLILGHTHALKFFPGLRVICSGCLTTDMNVYNDRGYVVITAGRDGTVQLTLNRIDGEKAVFDI